MSQSLSEGQSSAAPDPPKPARLLSLDAYRGIVMIALALEGFVPAVALKFPDSGLMQGLSRQFVHVDWEGGVFWDMIQPSFFFIIGVAMAYSSASRRSQGQSRSRVVGHVAYRSFVLVALGVLLASMLCTQTQFRFGEILAQIGLAFPLAFLLVGKPTRVQIGVCLAVLVLCWLAFFLYPLPSSTFDYTGLQIPPDAGPYTGLFAHWNKFTNLAYGFDRWFFNLFPRAEEFLGNRKYGPTLNVIPSAVTMVMGVMAGEALRSARSQRDKLLWLLAAGAGCLVVGLILGHTVVPIVKSLWTPSWVFYSGGIAFLAMAAVYWSADIKGWRALAFPFVVAGANSLVMYLMIRLVKFWLWDNLEIHLGGLLHIPHMWGWDFVLGTFIMWLVCLWLYRNRIFVRL